MPSLCTCNNIDILSTDKCLDIVCAGDKVIPRTMEWISSNAFALEVKASAALIAANIARNG